MLGLIKTFLDFFEEYKKCYNSINDFPVINIVISKKETKLRVSK